MSGLLPSPMGLLLGGRDIVAWLLGEGGGSAPINPGPAPSMGVDAISTLPPSAAIASLFLTTVLAAGTKHVTRDNVLDHDTRRAMYEYVWETGAAHLRRIAKALELSTTNATWHLDKLVDAGLIGEVKVNGYRMYYPKGGGRILREQCLLAGQIQSDNARAVVDYVAKNPGSHQREIARALGVNHGTARWHLSRLADADLLVAREEGRTTTYRLSDRAERVLTEMPPLSMQRDAQPA